MNATGFGLWPTPMSSDGQYSKSFGRGNLKLPGAVRQWATPSTNPTRPTEGNTRAIRRKLIAGELSLEEASRLLDGADPHAAKGALKATPPRLWPSPNVSGLHNRKGASLTSGDGLSTAVKDWEGLSRPMERALDKLPPLNPDWDEWLMGWPIGWTSLEPLPLFNVLFWVEAMNNGWWWDTDPAPINIIPRLKANVRGRQHRLRGIGNGQVPLAAYWAWQILSNQEQLR